MTLARFLLQNSLGKIQFFEKTFIFVNISIKIVLGMLFLTLNNTDFYFDTKKLIWRFYTTVDALPIISLVKLINKKEFTKTAPDRNSDTFVVYITTLKVLTIMPIHLFRAPMIPNNLTLAVLK